MKKAFHLFWPALLLPVLYLPYSWFLYKVVTPWLGCGCPSLSPEGEAVYSSFNSNDFTWYFWWAVALIAFVLSLRRVKELRRWQHKIVYLLFVALFCVFMVRAFCGALFLN